MVSSSQPEVSLKIVELQLSFGQYWWSHRLAWAAADAGSIHRLTFLFHLFLAKVWSNRSLTENDCFGESILLIGDKLYFNMVAEEDAVMLELSKRAFNHFIQQHTRVVPELGSFLALQLVEASEDVDEDMASDLTTEMEQRIGEFYKLPDEVEEVEEAEFVDVEDDDVPSFTASDEGQSKQDDKS